MVREPSAIFSISRECECQEAGKGTEQSRMPLSLMLPKNEELDHDDISYYKQ